MRKNFRFSIFDFRLGAAAPENFSERADQTNRTNQSDRVEAVACVLARQRPQSKIENRKSKIPAAFTMLEVLVALAIFAAMAVVLVASYLNVLTAYEVAGRGLAGELDVRFAREMLLAEGSLDAALAGADFEGADGGRVKWKAEIEPTETADLFLVTFTCDVDAAKESPARTVVETFRLLRPTWSQPSDRETLRADARQRILDMQITSPLSGFGFGTSSGGGSSGKAASGGKNTGGKNTGGKNTGGKNQGSGGKTTSGSQNKGGRR
ncbi:MAG: prepilin-type N-terminal cleavage/methylation domain-containing protein [Opitutaceae bacterium]|jgi:general secretion pathway protein I|nr:prepilin-type N-terminal cleavage/methylation domain-containing protein [Opitutaceae bacterium]